MNYSLQIFIGVFYCVMMLCILFFVENFNDVFVLQCGYYFYGKFIKFKFIKIKFFFIMVIYMDLKK